MVAPRVPAKGRSNGGVGKSFKGTAAYLLHDPDKATTDERVEWTETHNLATDDPQMAWRIMAATAKDAGRIQRDYHEATTTDGTPFKASRRGFNHVFHYSLSWRGDDEALGLTKAEMLQSARDSLKELGGEDLQALFVAHNDTANPHVHIMVNRVHPETGRIVPVNGNSKNRLRNWALHYERDRNMIVCHERERRAHLREAGVEYRSDTKPTEKQYRDQKAVVDAVQADPKRAQKVQAVEKAQDSALHLAGIDMRARHQGQWESLSRDHAYRKRMINDDADSAKKEAGRQISDQYAGKFESLWSRQREEVVQFHEDEQRFMGAFKNRFKAIRSIIGDDARTGAERFKATFQAMGDRGARLAALEVQHGREGTALKRSMKGEIKSARQDIETGRKEAIHDNYERYRSARAETETTQLKEREEHRQAWNDRDKARVERWESFAAEVEASKDLRAQYDEAKGTPFTDRIREDEDGRRQEAEANSRTSDRTSRDSFDLAASESLADAAAKATEPPQTAFKEASKDKSGPAQSIDD